MRTRTSTMAALAVATLAACTACLSGGAGASGTAATPTQTAPTEPPGTGAHAAALLATLPVRPEDTSAHYDRDDWGDWTSSNGCTIREALLIEQGTGLVRRADCSVGCPPLVAPCWHSPYDGLATGYARDLQVDHVVPLKEATQSGARDWPRERRVAFHNDHGNLVLASVHSNESKGDRDAAEWQPDAPFRCTYATKIIDVKSRYGLAVDPAEKSALATMVSTCP